MPREISRIAPGWWDYTTLESEMRMYDTLEQFYLAEALEYISAWRQSTADAPVGICGPIGPTEQLPLVAQL
ncbi:MAG: glucosamine-6-phosphate isomerase, partial [Gemmatimonadaceae bacterium]|nr:glucosamine-6-phosphate isomerase [Gemmatimonadaceae bacterium]